MVSASLIIIGNEVLSGRTQDKNMQMLAVELGKIGIILSHVRVIPDDESIIISTVNSCREGYDYVFTTGGIGPTHDDITSESIAKAFDVPLERHPDAKHRLLVHYGDDINEARLKMAQIPKGAQLIDNPVSAAPGFYIENVFVLAGVPIIAQAMVAFVKPLLKGGSVIQSLSVSAFASEGDIAGELAIIQRDHPSVDIGSYPMIKNRKLATTIVIRTTDREEAELVHDKVTALMLSLAGEIID